MPCMNHPEVMDGLSPCSKCGKSFCIDCLVGREAGWFCPECDAQAGVMAPAAAVPPPVLPPTPPPPPVVPAVIQPAPMRVAAVKGCANHPEVVDGLNPCSRCDRSYCPDCLVELKGGRFCARCKLDAVKDLQSGVSATGIQFAGIGARFLAMFVDGIITNLLVIPFVVILGVVMAAVQPSNDSAAMPCIVFGFYGLFFAALFCYHGFMLQYKGQTLGKMAAKVKVVSADGGKITPGQAWLRTITWFFLAGCGITYIPAFFTDEKTTIHDMIAKTRVVKVG